MSVNQNFSEVSPSLLLDFANSRTLDPRITFERSSIGTYVASNGLIKTAAADEPRFDHDPETGESLGLLIEESRTNIVTGVGGATSAILTSGQINELTGNNDAYLYQKNASSSVESQIAISVSGNVSTTSFTYSAFVKPGTSNKIYFQTVANNISDNAYHYFNIGDNTSVSVDYASSGNLTYTRTITPLHSGWYRLSVTIFGFSDTSLYLSQVRIGSFTGTTTHPYTNTTDTFYFYGPQVENGSFPTSYIPTSGSTLTRQPDNASITGTNFSDWYKIGDGSWYTEARGGKSKGSNAGRIISLSGGGAPTSSAVISTKASDSNGWNSYDGINNPTIQDGQEHYTAFGKCAVGYDASTLSIASDPSLTSNSTSLHGSRSYTGAIIGAFTNATTEHLNGHIKKLSYYPQRLTDSQLQNLTK